MNKKYTLLNLIKTPKKKLIVNFVLSLAFISFVIGIVIYAIVYSFKVDQSTPIKIALFLMLFINIFSLVLNALNFYKALKLDNGKRILVRQEIKVNNDIDNDGGEE